MCSHNTPSKLIVLHFPEGTILEYTRVLIHGNYNFQELQQLQQLITGRQSCHLRIAAGAQCNSNSVSLWYADVTQTLGLTFWMQMLSRLVSDLLCYQRGLLLPAYPALLISILCDMILENASSMHVGQTWASSTPLVSLHKDHVHV